MAEDLPGNAVEESGYGSDNIPEENLTRAYDLLKEKNAEPSVLHARIFLSISLFGS